MSNNPSVFPFWHITLTAGITPIISFAMLLILQRRGDGLSLGAILWLAFLAGLSVLFWWSAGNVAQLNNDPVPPFSPNDLICPIFTYIFLDLATAFRRPIDFEHWEKTRAWLTLISFVVNVLMI